MYSLHFAGHAPAVQQGHPGINMARDELLKKDLFGEVWLKYTDEGTTIVRDTASARFWLRWFARALMRREARVLAMLDGLHGVPQLLSLNGAALTRSYISGRPMQEARPTELQFFKRAAAQLRKLHTAGVVHNDLAKEPNILVDDRGQPAFIDFQLAGITTHRGRLFRALAYDDIRHLLKHKRTYCPDALTARERKILNNPSRGSKLWMRTGKPIYLFITRRLLGWADREGAADRGRRS